MLIGYQENLFRDAALSRTVILAVLSKLSEKVILNIPEWKSDIKLKFFYSLTGDERFLYDASPKQLTPCKAETLYQTLPRAVIDITKTSILEDGLSNKRIRLRQVLHESENDVAVLNTYSVECNVVPFRYNLSLNVLANSNTESMLLAEGIMKTFYKFQKMYINHNGFRMPVELTIPSDYNLSRPIEFSFADRKEHKLDLELICDTFLPITFEETRLNASKRVPEFTFNLKSF